jgi:hypothetical protein
MTILNSAESRARIAHALRQLGKSYASLFACLPQPHVYGCQNIFLHYMDSRITVSAHMYDLKDEKESGKCKAALPNCRTTGKAPPERATASSAARPSVDVGQHVIEVMTHRNRGRWVRAAQLPELFCSWDLAYRCTKSGWLRPIVQGKRRTIYRLADVLACMQRIEAGDLPLPRHNKPARQQGD